MSRDGQDSVVVSAVNGRFCVFRKILSLGTITAATCSEPVVRAVKRASCGRELPAGFRHRSTPILTDGAELVHDAAESPNDRPHPMPVRLGPTFTGDNASPPPPKPNSSRLTSFKSTRLESPANNVGPWPAILGCTTNSYSSNQSQLRQEFSSTAFADSHRSCRLLNLWKWLR